MTSYTKPREDTIRAIDTLRGLAPEPPSDSEATRARQCLEALFAAAAKSMGTDALDQLVLDARQELEPGRDASTSRRQVARDLAERLFRGRP